MKLKVLLGILASQLCVGAVNVPLTVQEAIYPGVTGWSRSGDPVTIGVPLPDDTVKGVTDPGQLSLTGASVGQFRVLGRWPSGRIKWVEVDTQASLGAGGSNNSIVLTSGNTGNFGGANLASDDGAVITVDTGSARFTVRKSKFNGIDEAAIGSTVVVASGASRGLVLYGPAPGQSVCPPCTNFYSSANDTNSTAIIEENGPAKAVIRASGSHVDAQGNAYMRFTVRLYFFKNKTHVKITSVLRNADYGVSNSLAAAYKGHQGYELQITPALSGAGTFAIGNHTSSPSTGSLNGTDSVYLYQGESDKMKWQDWCGYGCVPYTTDSGYSIMKNGTTILSGSNTQYPEGWADVRGSSGAGVQIGIYQLAAYSPKSLRFDNGGNDVRIGIWARENSRPFYQSWPQWSINELYLNFHAAPLATPATEFLRYQHYLLGRAGRNQYNEAKVFPYPLIDPSAEDAFYRSTQTSANPATISSSKACCIQDFGVTDLGNWPLHVFRFYGWNAGGGGNQTEFRWSYLLNFLTRGMTGRYLEAAHFYRFQSEAFLPHSDGFEWRNKLGEVDGFGFPTAVSANSAKAFRNWRDQEHGHWYGMTDYYFMSGDETIREALNDQAKDWFLNKRSYQAGALGNKSGTVTTNGAAVRLVIGSAFIPNMAKGSIYLNGVVYGIASVTDANNLVLTSSAGNQTNVQYYSLGGLYNSRAVGVQLIGAARYSQFLGATSDADAAGVLAQGTNTFLMQTKPELCVSGYPNGCTAGVADGGPWATQGVSRVRGVPWGPAGTSGSWCGVSHAYRVNSSFQPAILIQGLLELRNAAGPNWTEYWNALDLAYGVARWNLSENYVDDGSGRWDSNGFRFGVALDRANSCTEPGESPEPNFQPTPTQTTAMTFLAKYLVDGDTTWGKKFAINLQKDMAALGTTTSDFGSYQPAAVIDILNNPSPNKLQQVALTDVISNGEGSYTISWKVPSGTTSYRIKWAPKQIVDWIGFDPANNRFIGDPAQTVPWFAAKHFDAPAPLSAAATQNVTIATGIDGLTALHFNVKAYTSSSIAPAPSRPTPSELRIVSGSGQSGVAGRVLPGPLAVKVIDVSGSPIPGIGVDFVVTAGGGAVAPATAVTDSLGVASVSWSLGSGAGINSVQARSGSLSPLNFIATATVPNSTATTLTLVSGSGQTGTAGQPLPAPLVARVTDQSTDPVAGVLVAFAVTTGGGQLSISQTISDSQGLVSTVLTLGPGAGANTVRASSGTLNGSPLTFSATVAADTTSSAVTWRRQTPTTPWPAWVAWLVPLYDPVSQRTMVYAAPNDYTGIYSTRMFAYQSATNTFTDLGGTSSKINACPVSTPTQPGDRHPGWQMAIDTKRNRLWLYGGVNVNCPDNPRLDTYYMTLNSNPASNAWTRVSAPTTPAANSASAMIYDPDNDVLFAFGSDTAGQTRANWVYCPADENPTSGALTARQAATGCVRPNDWNLVSPVGGIQPPAVNFPGMVYDSVTKKVVLFGGMSSGLTISYNQVWTYDVAIRAWTRKALSTTQPPPYNGTIVAQPAMAYNSKTNKIVFHQTHNTGAPADWEYDPITDTWKKLTSSGSGPVSDAFISYEAASNVLVSWSRNASSGRPDVWIGSLSDSPTPSEPSGSGKTCDLNSDGLTNVVDVQLAVRQAIGAVSCQSADLNDDKLCNEVDVQKIVTASLGGACSLKP